MKVFTASAARERFTELLETAHGEGEVRITDSSGRVFSLRREDRLPSALDVPAATMAIDRADIVSAVRQSRERPGV